ncbi:SLC13 family permease [Skermanella mucosa]|uniref:SLC13 family permease n=1 Tax=Skermanella mucosa TaxID=1789672 RepID=UPI00192B40BC|nr:SLC13 family permease [Skermanella mucosa]UEM23539.1 SLC13 family permease [Skermanella mucosa]
MAKTERTARAADAADAPGSRIGRIPVGRSLLAVGAGFLLFVVMLLLPPPAGMSETAWTVAAVAILMAAWWVTEALPLAATALIPIVAFPLLGVATSREAATPYADPLIFLFLGGFVLGLGLQRWNLHRRIALTIISWVGTQPARLVGGFMLATAFLSMWVSNTATAVMMLPVALSVIALLQNDRSSDARGDADGALAAGRRNFAVSLLLAVAYGASIGGLATLIGTPPNALLAAYMARTYQVEIGFAQWMMVGVPLVLVMLALTWALLTQVVFRTPAGAIKGAMSAVGSEIASLGPMSRPEKLVGMVFVATAAAWILRPLLSDFIPGLDDTVIAMASALLLFLIPSGSDRGGFLMDWDTARGIPWGVLLLFGGGLSLASAISDSGLAEWLGQTLGLLGSWPVILVMLVATLAVIFLTELTSNTATAAAFLPLVGSVAVGIGMDPFMLTMPVALAASCAFMLPVATPPNAIVYGSGNLTVADMAKAGFYLNLISTLLITGLTYLAVGTLFSVA